MAQLQYIGARYTTKVYENSNDPSSAEWESGVKYEPLVLVTFNNSSYLSKKIVPASIGNPAANPIYWICTGYYNGQILALQNDVSDLKNLVKYVTPELFGAMGDGVTDDSDALQDCITYAINNKLGIVGRTGAVYYTTQALTIDNTNDPFPFLLDFNNAQIKFANNIPIGLTLNLTGTGLNRHNIVNNLSLIGGQNTNAVLYIDNSRQLELNNLTVMNCRNIGVDLHSNQYEVYFTNCIIWGESDANSIGVNIDAAHDLLFSGCRVINTETAFKIDGTGNMFDNCHIWTDLEGSVGFDVLRVDNVINACTIDSFETAIKLKEPYVSVTNNIVYAMYTSGERSTAPAFLSIPAFNAKNYRKAIVTSNYIRFKLNSGFVQDGYFLREGDNKLFGNTANNMLFEQPINPNRITPTLTSPDANVTIDKNYTMCEGDKCHLYLCLSLTTPLAVDSALTFSAFIPDYMRPTDEIVGACIGKSNFYAGLTNMMYLFIGNNGTVQISNKTSMPISYIIIDYTFDISA